jgi:hypothetical protein
MPSLNCFKMSEKVDYILKGNPPGRSGKRATKVKTDLSFCDHPVPHITFEGRTFCLTGAFEFANGDRNKCEEAIFVRGGVCCQSINQDLDFLVVGTYAESAWAHGKYGRKIERAIDLKHAGGRCRIVSEQDFLKALNCFPEVPPERRRKPGPQSRTDEFARVAELEEELATARNAQRIFVQVLKENLNPDTLEKISARMKEVGIIVRFD